MTKMRRAALTVLWLLAGCATDAGIAAAPADLCADGPTLEFVDVSVYQGTIDWDALRGDARVSGAIIRASNGIRVDDAQFVRNWTEARRVGMPRGAYHFYEHCQDPNAQADHFLAMIASAGGSAPDDLPLMLDWEWSDMEAQCRGIPYPPAATYIANIQTFLDRIEAATGKAPIIYTSWVFLQAAGLSSGASLGGGRRASVLPDTFVRYPLIVPAYTADCNRVEVPAPWTRWTAWQFTSTGMRNGIATSVDVNQFNGDATAWMALYAPPLGSALPDPPASCDYVACSSDAECGADETCVSFEGIATASASCTVRVCASARSDLGYVPLDAPTRAIDATVAAGTTTVTLPAVPAGAQGVAMNVVLVPDAVASAVAFPGGVVPPSAHVTAYPGGAHGAFTVAAVRGGAVQIDVHGSGRLVVDVSGYLVLGTGLYFHPTPVGRMLDTRSAGGPLAAGESRAVPLGLPEGTIAALDVTAVSPTSAGYLTLTSGGVAPTSFSSLNYGANETIANRAFVRVDGTGGVSVFSNAGGLDVVVDLAGSFDASPSGGYTFRTHAPVRVVDTREGRGHAGDLVGGTASTLSFASMPAGAAGGFFTLHALGRSAAGYLQLYAGAMPAVSDLNYPSVRTVSGGLPLVLRADRSADVFANQGVGLVTEIDALLYPYAPPAIDAAVDVDAGVAGSDAATTLDGGGVPGGDGGLARDGGSADAGRAPTTLSGSCGCRAASPSASPRGLTLGLVLAAALIVRRARRHRRA